ncbi:hypothetical protein AFK24_17605 [Pseudomonas syringae]|uniref:Uncharacterized protein n=1 Tax=Pseudomonas syringae TaxID=317 RepID=A0A1C7Z3T7_PSESX|nr:hypothetical protein AFK24_17605 [Pseudomonas syringae]
MIGAVSSQTICTYVISTIGSLAICTNMVGTVSSQTICTYVISAIGSLTILTHSVSTISSQTICTYVISAISSLRVVSRVGVRRTAFSDNGGIEQVAGIDGRKSESA